MARKVKIMQKNWIGKSIGCELNFKVKNNKNHFGFYYSTRYNFGASFLALAVDHPLSKEYENDPEFVKFKKNCYKSGNTDEAIAKTEKLGFKSKYEVIHPFIKKKHFQFFLPILF